MVPKNPKLTLVAQPQEFFHELVTTALERQHVRAQPEIEFYLVNLLNQFMTSDRLFRRDAEGSTREDALVLQLKEAIEEPTLPGQRALFRHIGDVSLYTAGFFQESLNRKLVDVDYYIEMGGTAYQQAAARAEESHLSKLYGELADRFSKLVDVLAEISDQTTPRSERDLLRLYDTWVRTGSERAAKALKDAGIISAVRPAPGPKKPLQ